MVAILKNEYLNLHQDCESRMSK